MTRLLNLPALLPDLLSHPQESVPLGLLNPDNSYLERNPYWAYLNELGFTGATIDESNPFYPEVVNTRLTTAAASVWRQLCDHESRQAAKEGVSATPLGLALVAFIQATLWNEGSVSLTAPPDQTRYKSITPTELAEVSLPVGPGLDDLEKNVLNWLLTMTPEEAPLLQKPAFHGLSTITLTYSPLVGSGLGMASLLPLLDMDTSRHQTPYTALLSHNPHLTDESWPPLIDWLIAQPSPAHRGLPDDALWKRWFREGRCLSPDQKAALHQVLLGPLAKHALIPECVLDPELFDRLKINLQNDLDGYETLYISGIHYLSGPRWLDCALTLNKLTGPSFYRIREFQKALKECAPTQLLGLHRQDLTPLLANSEKEIRIQALRLASLLPQSRAVPNKPIAR